MSLKFDSATKTVTLEIGDIGRTNRQRLAIHEFIKTENLADLIDYVNTFNGKRSRISIERYSSKRRYDDKKVESGKYLAMFEKMLDTDTNHSPMNKDKNWVGVEIECFIPFKSFPADGESKECRHCDGDGTIGNCNEDECGDCGDHREDCERCEGTGTVTSYDEDNLHKLLSDKFKELKIKLSSVKGDGSIRPDKNHFAVEITVLTQISKPDNLERACKLLNQLGAKVNKTCGMHVHLDARHLDSDDVQAIGRKFTKVMPILLGMVPESRRNNSYCRPSVSKMSGQRYHAVNLTSFRKHKTIEIRLHSSTTDFDKIIKWATLLNAIATAKKISKVKSINDLESQIDISEELMEYMAQRTALFSPAADCSSASALDADSTEPQRAQVALNNLEFTVGFSEAGQLTVEYNPQIAAAV